MSDSLSSGGHPPAGHAPGGASVEGAQQHPRKPSAAIPQRWPGATIAVIAPGPSLTRADAEAVSAAADHVIAVGDAWRLAPWAAVLYHADGRWWWHHAGVPEFRGERWTQDKGTSKPARPQPHGDCVDAFGMAMVRSEAGTIRDRNGATVPAGLSFDPALIHQGFHSGFQAFNLAVLFGGAPAARPRVLLLGFDCQATGGRKHYFGDHPGDLDRDHGYAEWLSAFAAAAPQCRARGIVVVNCTRQTALTCFACAPVEAL